MKLKQKFKGIFKLYKKLQKRFSLFGYIIIRGISVPIRILINVAGIRLYGEQVVGAFSVSRSVLDLSIVAGGLGSDKTMIHLLSHAKVHKKADKFAVSFNRLFIIYGLLGSLLGILVYMFSGLLASFYNKPWLIPYLHITAITIPIILLLVLVQQGLRASKHAGWANLIETTLYNILTLGIILAIFVCLKVLHLSVIYGFHIGFMLGTLFTLFLGLYILNKKEKILEFKNLKNSINKGIFLYLKKAWQIGKYLMFLNILLVFLLNLDKWLLPIFVSGVDLGFYYVIAKAGAMLQIISNAMLTSTPFDIAKLHKTRLKEQMHKYVLSKTKQVLKFSVLGLVVLIFVAPVLLLLFGKSYLSGYFLAILYAIAFIFWNLSALPIQALVISNKFKKLLMGLAVVTAISVVLMYLLIAKFMLLGAVFGMVLSFGMLAFMAWTLFLE